MNNKNSIFFSKDIISKDILIENDGSGILDTFGDLYKKYINLSQSTLTKIAAGIGLAAFIAQALLKKNGSPQFHRSYGNGFHNRPVKELIKEPVKEMTKEELNITYDNLMKKPVDILFKIALKGLGVAAEIALIILQKKLFDYYGLTTTIPVRFMGGAQFYNRKPFEKPFEKPIEKSFLDKIKNYSKAQLEKMKKVDLLKIIKSAITGGLLTLAIIAIQILYKKYGYSYFKQDINIDENSLFDVEGHPVEYLTYDSYYHDPAFEDVLGNGVLLESDIYKKYSSFDKDKLKELMKKLIDNGFLGLSIIVARVLKDKFKTKNIGGFAFYKSKEPIKELTKKEIVALPESKLKTYLKAALLGGLITSAAIAGKILYDKYNVPLNPVPIDNMSFNILNNIIDKDDKPELVSEPEILEPEILELVPELEPVNIINELMKPHKNTLIKLLSDSKALLKNMTTSKSDIQKRLYKISFDKFMKLVNKYEIPKDNTQLIQNIKSLTNEVKLN